MKNYLLKKVYTVHPYLLLLLVLLIAYLPLSSLHFAMKNDAFSDNFPDKYFLSQALHAGIFPLWNPYMNFGFPIYADPGFAFWNPITWLFAAVGYNAYILTLEVLCYLYIAGICLYNLGRYLKFSKRIAFAIAAMYMCSGFFVGSIQYINFIIAAAFLPLLLQSFLQLLELPSLQKSAKFSLAFYCVCMGGHPAIPIASVYFVAVLFILHCIYFNNGKDHLKKAVIYLLISVFILALLTSPMLYSYINIWKFYGRNSAQQDFNLMNTGMDFSSLISFLFPFSTTSHSTIFTSDVAMRNIYISLFGFISLMFAFKQKNKLVRVFFIAGFIMLLLSFAGNFKTVIYNFLPGLNYVRTNGEFRVFTTLLFCLISGFGFTYIFNDNKAAELFKRVIKFFSISCLIIFITVIIFYKNELSAFIHSLTSNGSGLAVIKTFLDTENFMVAFLISLLIAMLLCIPFLFLKIKLKKLLIPIIILDLIINSILYLPVTGIGTKTLADIQSIYNSNPKGIPVPELIPVNKIDTLDTKTTGLIGDISYYNKKIGTTKLTDYPSYFTTTDSFFKSSEKDFVLAQPYLFLKSGKQNLQVKKLSPQQITISINSDDADSLFFLQNQYKFWKAYNNKKEITITKAFTTFMSVPLQKGNNEIEFVYKDRNLLYFVCLSFLTLISSIIIISRRKNVTTNQASITSVLLK